MTSHVLETVATPACLDQVHELFEALWIDVPDVVARDRIAFETAVSEVAANIVEHAAAMRDDIDLRLVLCADVERVEAKLQDGGYPYDADLARDRTGPDDEHGRGLMIATALTDELVYERDGPINRWYLARRRSA